MSSSVKSWHFNEQDARRRRLTCSLIRRSVQTSEIWHLFIVHFKAARTYYSRRTKWIDVAYDIILPSHSSGRHLVFQLSLKFLMLISDWTPLAMLTGDICSKDDGGYDSKDINGWGTLKSAWSLCCQLTRLTLSYNIDIGKHQIDARQQPVTNCGHLLNPPFVRRESEINSNRKAMQLVCFQAITLHFLSYIATHSFVYDVLCTQYVEAV